LPKNTTLSLNYDTVSGGRGRGEGADWEHNTPIKTNQSSIIDGFAKSRHSRITFVIPEEAGIQKSYT
jgi:hypothetical protein